MVRLMANPKTSTICSFPSTDTPPVSAVGGKGHALIQLSRFMPVPPGMVLTTEFFKPWWQSLFNTEEWKDFETATEKELATFCAALKSVAMLCTFTDDQNDQLAELLENFNSDELFAVRSSSPEEDLEGSSFAGAYETVLGVTRKNIQAGVRTCFASCLDYRIVSYKRKHGFDIRKPKIAVVIQKQIASEISGVAFSLNPLTNDFDEAVINANFGLGETVVAGDVTPDQFIVGKVDLKVKEKTLGQKQRSIWLMPNGGTTHREGNVGDAERFCLTDGQALEVTRLLKTVESRNAKPMDIEWAYERGKLYLLQARPITGYQPLPPDLVTAPGKRRRLYLDVTRSVQGIEKPLSEMGASAIKHILKHVSSYAFGRDITDHIDHTLPYVTAGRVYVNVSNALSFASKEKVIERLNLVDPLAAKAIGQLDESFYKPATSELRHLPFLLAKRLPGLAKLFLRARVHPEAVRDEAIVDLEVFRQQLMFLRRSRLKLREFATKVWEVAARLVFSRFIVLLIVGLNAKAKIEKLAGKEFAAEAELLTKALPGNLTVQMGLELYTVAQLLPEDVGAAELGQRVQNRDLPADFMLAWDGFIGKYGHRAALEFDIATPRYREDSSFLINQLQSLSALRGTDVNPRAKYEDAVRAREAAFIRMRTELAKRSRLDMMRFESAYRVMTCFLGLRETPKFCSMLAMDAIRQRILEAGAHLVSLRQLNSIDEVFDVSFEQLCAALEGTLVDLHAIVATNKARRARLHLDTLPKIFDSRGRIIRPPAVATKENELAGTPISPGTVIGIARVLHRPDERALQTGDILVARATDPGWTPLFAVASGVVLEVGGLLQHGALVAREYGLPCVAGIDRVTEVIKDGSRIEVDGTNGIVRLL